MINVEVEVYVGQIFICQVLGRGGEANLKKSARAHWEIETKLYAVTGSIEYRK